MVKSLTFLLLVAATIICGVQSYGKTIRPPVNTPNDCNIRCVTTPCPCGKTCPQLNCPRRCNRWKVDSRNCNTCECDDCPLGNPCAVVRCGTNTTPTVITPDQGCPTCQCVPREKPGTCPAPSGLIGICIVRCAGDFSCPGNQKCCGSCPRECVNPAPDCLENPCSVVRCGSGTAPVVMPSDTGCSTCKCVPREKPGVCPVSPTGFGICIARCTDDSSCPGDQKCCGGCPRECVDPQPECLENPCSVVRCGSGTAPVVIPSDTGCSTCKCVPRQKPGVCPAPSTRPGICIARCTDDSSCPGDEKCCGSCPRQCTDPNQECPTHHPCAATLCSTDTIATVVTPDKGCPRCECVPKEKPGRCPRSYYRRSYGTCDVRCENDASCSGDMKCCGSCPRKCTRPSNSRYIYPVGK